MKKSVKNTIVALLLLTLSISTASLVYLHFFAADHRNLTGEWTAEPDLTAQAAVRALDWLQDMEAVSVALEDVESCMGKITVQVQMTMEQTERFQGTFQCHILPESYDACRQKAYEGFAAAFRELLGERLRMAGCQGDTGDAAVEALVEETFGMSTVSYLMSCGPALLPSLEELQAQYDGSGTYTAEEGVLAREYEAGSVRMEDYIREDGRLVLFGETNPAASDAAAGSEPVVFILNPPER